MLSALLAGEPSSVDVLEQETPTYTATLKDDVGVAIPAATLTTLTLTLYVLKTEGSITYIRSSQNVLNANNVTVDANGLVTWAMQVADTTLKEAVPFERHIALWQWTWGSGKRGKHEVVFVVKNLLTVS